eukprot:TRINITY_DN7289_c0_g2_i1.p1 TRINITY_DN7289_c0_g2~~TRINITY_DN7289_c0_g2_i1.p1  ORF type:complete len:386 (+),score=129.66 TRINITY_DN7289_c0_g2_i1:71-1159(+)
MEEIAIAYEEERLFEAESKLNAFMKSFEWKEFEAEGRKEGIEQQEDESENQEEEVVENKEEKHEGGGESSSSISSFSKSSSGKSSVELEKIRMLQKLAPSIRSECDEIRRLLGSLESEDGWTKQKDSDGIRVLYRHEEGSSTHSLRVDAVMECPVLNLACCINELDLFVEWVPFLRASRRLAQLSRARQLGHFRMGLPWPFSDRDAVVYGYGVDLLKEHNRIVIFTKSVVDYEGLEFIPAELESTKEQIPDEDKKVVRMQVHMAGIILEVIDEGRTRLLGIMNADPQMAWVPYWLLNFIARNVIHVLIRRLRKRAASLHGTSHEERLIQNKEVYGFLRNRLREVYGFDMESGSVPTDPNLEQ